MEDVEGEMIRDQVFCGVSHVYRVEVTELSPC